MVAIKADAITAVSKAAVCILILEREVWIPKSIIFEGDEITQRSSQPQELNVEAWFVKKEGLRD